MSVMSIEPNYEQCIVIPFPPGPVDHDVSGAAVLVMVIWTSCHLELDITFDQAYAQAQMQHLQSFYFAHMLD